MSNDLFSGLGDFFNQLFGAFGAGSQTDQPQQNPQQDADLFTKFFGALPDKGKQFAQNFQPPRQPSGWEDAPTLSSVVTAPFREDVQARSPANPAPSKLGAPPEAVKAPQAPITEDPKPVPSQGSLVGEVRAHNGAKLLSMTDYARGAGEPEPKLGSAPDFATRFDPTKITGKTNHGQSLTHVFAPDGTRANMNAKFATRFQGLINDLHAAGYKNFDLFSGGGYADRKIRGSNTLSRHATADAIDINPSKNPMKRGALSTDMPKNISALAAKWGLKWGGDWTGRKDPMHFEVDYGVADTDLASLRAWQKQTASK